MKFIQIKNSIYKLQGLILSFAIVSVSLGLIPTHVALAACDVAGMQPTTNGTIQINPSSVDENTKFTVSANVPIPDDLLAGCKADAHAASNITFSFVYTLNGKAQIFNQTAHLDTQVFGSSFTASNQQGWKSLGVGDVKTTTVSIEVLVKQGNTSVSRVGQKQTVTLTKGTADGGGPTDSTPPDGSGGGSPPANGSSGGGSGLCATDGYENINGLCIPKNPFGGEGLTGSKSIGDLITRVLKILLTLAGIVAVLFIIIGGFLYITSYGNEQQAEKGKKALQYALMGLGIVILSYVLVYVVTDLLTSGNIFSGVSSGGNANSNNPVNNSGNGNDHGANGNVPPPAP